MVTHEQLKELLLYSPKTGLFIWRVNKARRIKKNSIAGYNQNGYTIIQINNKQYRANRLAWFYMKGYWPEYEIDHKDRIRNNNKWDNLRHVTPSCNAKNRNIRKDNTSGIVGVNWHNDRSVWTANITINKKQKRLGYFDYFLDAVKARWKAEVKYNYPNCNTTSTAYSYLKEKGEI